MTERTEAVSSTGVARRGGDSVDTLAAMIRDRAPVTVLTGAGVSTASGIPDYRDADGAWKQKQPMQYREFMSTGQARRRYWARSFIGWPRFAAARPNSAHLSLAELGRRGIVGTVISQNVDGLHRAAAQPSVIDLHGRLSEVVCTECGALTPRSDLQRRLEALNPGFHRLAPGVASAADGDAMLESGDESFSIAGCIACGGVLKPNVVFFGEAVPRRRVERGFGALTGGGLLLVVGSSVMVFSGYRFCREARQRGIPVAVVNRGRTRADDVADLKIADDCSRVLEALGARLAAS